MVFRHLFFFLVFISSLAVSSQTSLNDYSFVLVPDRYDILGKKDQYLLNSMSVFYFEKSGFNVFEERLPGEVNPCDGLYADVEEESGFTSIRLQVVLKDCNGREIYRSQEGRSKFKEWDRRYQDALRNAFKSIELLHVKQQQVSLSVSIDEKPKTDSSFQSQGFDEKGFPLGQSTQYQFSNRFFVLEKSPEGYSFYEKFDSKDPELKGKIVFIGELVRFLDISGNVNEIIFQKDGSFILKEGTSAGRYVPAD